MSTPSPMIESSAARVPSQGPAGLVAVDGRDYPLREARLQATAQGGFAETRLIQRYANPYPEALEVFYTLPLPGDAAVLGYTITLGERTITGEVQGVEQARDRYREALAEGRTAGLLEQVRADSFLQSLGSLPGGCEVQVEISLCQPLSFVSPGERGHGEWEYRFPTVVGVRYQGAPGRVPDAHLLDVDRVDRPGGTPVRLELDLNIEDRPDDVSPRSDSHVLRVEPHETGARVSLAEAAPLDRDLVVRWRATRPEVGVAVLHDDGSAGETHALLTIVPPTRPVATFPRDVTLLVDASGSMHGPSLECCKRVGRAVLEGLGARDRFELLAFSSTARRFAEAPLPATDVERERALDWLDALQAGGGTEMASAMREALTPRRADAQRQVVLLSDGFIGFEQEVFDRILRGAKSGCRVHTVGVGAAPNRSLTSAAARAGQGREVLVSDPEVAQVAAMQLKRATEQPVITDLEISGRGCRGFAPRRLPDLLAGRPARVGMILGAGPVSLTGRLPDGERWCVELMGGASSEGCPVRLSSSLLPLGALYAREMVADLELDATFGQAMGDTAAVKAHIEELGVKYGIVTSRTAMVAISEEPDVDPRAPRRRRRLEVELPRGVSAEAVGLALHAPEPLGTYLRSMPSAPDWHSNVRHRPAFGFDDEDSMDATFAPRESHDLQTRILKMDGVLLVIEFEVPADGLEISANMVRLGYRPSTLRPRLRLNYRYAASNARVRLDEASSAPAGHYASGVTVRLGLRLSRLGRGWQPGTWMVPLSGRGNGRDLFAYIEVPDAR